MEERVYAYSNTVVNEAQRTNSAVYADVLRQKRIKEARNVGATAISQHIEIAPHAIASTPTERRIRRRMSRTGNGYSAH